MKKILLIILTLFCFINVKAYENEYFNIQIPDNYKEEIIDNKTYKWINNNKYIAITISDNTQLKYNIEKYTKEDIDNQKEYIESNLNEKLQEYNLKVTVTNIEKKKINNHTALNYTIYWPSNDTTGYDTYQIGNVFTTDNYIITIIYNSDEKITDKSDYHQIISNIQINDNPAKFKLSKEYIISIFAIAITLAIFKTITKYKKKKA